MKRIYTIGHSTLALEPFISLLLENGINRLADIRRYPASRRYPHFDAAALERELPRRGISYVHVEELGGRRKPAAASRNMGLRNEQFRGYADHMATAAFQAVLDELLDSDSITAVMCAEAVPWRCHRNLLADELVRRGIEVLHILGAGSVRGHAPHTLASFELDRVVYPPEQAGMFR